MVTAGLLFNTTIFYEKSIGLELNFNKAFFNSFYVVMFPALSLITAGKKVFR